MSLKDIIEIENLQGRYMHLLISGNFEQASELFSDEPDTSFHFANRNREPFIGKENIHQKMFMERMCGSFTEYDRFHAGGQVVAPYIDVDDDGVHAFGMFPALGYFVKGKLFGFDAPPYPTTINTGMWYHEFIKENGKWKIHPFHTGNVTDCEGWQWDPRKGDGYAELGMARRLPYPPEAKERG